MRERLAAYPTLTAQRLFREIKKRGYSGGYNAVRDRVLFSPTVNRLAILPPDWS